MLSVKLVRSLVLGESITHHHHHHDHDHQPDDHHDEMTMKKKKKMPMLLFTPTKELICDTFRLATIARDLGMDFHPSSSLSHLLFSWPTPSPPPSLSSSSANITNHRTSVSSQTSTFTHTSITSSSTATTSSTVLQNDAVPIPFPSLSTNSSISLLRSFVSLSKGLFKLVFIDLCSNPNPNFRPDFVNYYHSLLNYDAPLNLSLFSRVSGKQVKSIDDLSTELAGKGWSLFRTPVKKVSPENSVYLFRKMDPNRVRVKIVGVGECRVREMRLPAIDFEKGVNLRVLLYILLMTDDVFYLA
ncbi:hypothetical protein RND81_09G233300 [Saponaria officinalis]|uniref:Uncharacterized protein n=1 Tax=Saponaria officinalis TaxID=3572 RepID=A0AAW1IR85_SAPOF